MKRRPILLVASLVASITLQIGGGDVASANSACQESGENCKVGDVGPGGGIVFYDAGSLQTWGRFLEAKTTATPANGIWGSSSELTQFGVGGKRIGMGPINSFFMYQDESSVMFRLWKSYFDLGASAGMASFYLPSKDELDALYNYWKISGDERLKYPAAPMWTSSEASATFAWYQLFQDGTQFTDANGIIPKLGGNKAFLKSPKHVGSDFEPTSFQVIGVRPFPSVVLIPPTSVIVNNPSTNGACSNGGAATVCKVGDIGPGGGIVFFDAGKDEYWGRYLEMAPKICEREKLPWRPAGNTKTVYNAANGQSAAELRVLAKGVGMGKVNTRIITLALGAGDYAAKYAEDLNCSGVDDWFLPSKDELDLAYNRLAQNRVGGQDTPVGAFNKGYYWTSTDYNNNTAWSQYFMDGQQFDRVQTLSGNKKPPANPFRVRPIRAFGTNNVVLSCAQGGTCKVGDIGPGGGKVFYVAPDLLLVNGKSWRYLEADPLIWPGQVTLCTYVLRCNQSKIQVKKNWLVGKGALNTTELMKMNEPGSAQSIARNAINGKTDWFIPSRDELKLLYKSKSEVGGFVDGLYWTSTRRGGGTASLIDFEDGSETMEFMDDPFNLRLIRAFG